MQFARRELGLTWETRQHAARNHLEKHSWFVIIGGRHRDRRRRPARVRTTFAQAGGNDVAWVGQVRHLRLTMGRIEDLEKVTYIVRCFTGRQRGDVEDRLNQLQDRCVIEYCATDSWFVRVSYGPRRGY